MQCVKIIELSQISNLPTLSYNKIKPTAMNMFYSSLIGKPR